MSQSFSTAMTGVESPRCLTLVADLRYTIMEVSGTPGNYTFSGPLTAIVDIIMNHLGFCYKFVRSPDRSYGELYPNGSWSGLLGMVQRREADFTGTLVMATSAGLDAFTYSEPLVLSEYNVMNARPGLTPNVAGFIWPFTQLLWILLLLSSVIVFVAMILILQGHAVLVTDDHRERSGSDSSEEEQKEERNRGSWRTSAYRSFLWTWSALMSQSVSWEPRGNAARMVAGMWLLWTLIMCTLYRSNLKAMLILPKVRLPFDNLEELVASGVSLGIPEHSLVQALVKHSDSSSLLARLRPRLVTIQMHEYQKYREDIYSGKMAVSSYTSSLKRGLHNDFSTRGTCRSYLMSRGFFGPASLSMVFLRDSPLAPRVNRIIAQLRETGILDHLLDGAHFNASECLKPITSTISMSKERPLELLDFYGVFALYLAGIVLALLVFLLEMTIDHTKRGRKLNGNDRTP